MRLHALLAFSLIAFLSGHAFNLDGLKCLHKLYLPASEFFGSATFVARTNAPWVCELGNGYLIEVVPWNTDSSDDYWEPLTQFRLYVMNADSVSYSLVSEKKVKSRGNLSALRLTQTPDRLLLTGPGGTNVFNDLPDRIPPLAKSSLIGIYSTKNDILTDAANNFEPYPEPVRVRVKKSETLPRNPVSETDRSGVWTYLDNVTPNNGSVRIGGRYKILIVPDRDGGNGYSIVYFGGASERPSFWKKGYLKGRLEPTSFDNHYNLVWYDHHRQRVDMGEASATFDGINLLTLDFPLFKSQIRFQRILPQ